LNLINEQYICALKEVIYLFGLDQSYCNLSNKKSKTKKRLISQHGFSVITGRKEFTNADSPIEYSKAVAKLDLYRDDFYTEDIVQFYQIVTKNKDKLIIRHYTSILQLIGSTLSDYGAFSWKDIRQDFWEELITFQLLNRNIEINNHQIDSFLSLICHFIRWLDTRYETINWDFVEPIIENNKNFIIDCVYINNTIRNTRCSYKQDLEGLFTFPPLNDDDELPGLFLVEKIKNNFIIAFDMVTRENYSIRLPKVIAEKYALHFHFLLHGVIKKTSKFDWKFINIVSVYPSNAKQYAKKNLLYFHR
jgi:hypothetical protein